MFDAFQEEISYLQVVFFSLTTFILDGVILISRVDRIKWFLSSEGSTAQGLNIY